MKTHYQKFKGRCCLAVEKMWETLMRHISGQVFILFYFFLFMSFCFPCSKTNGKECKKGGEISPIDTILELQQELLIVLFSDFYQPLH